MEEAVDGEEAAGGEPLDAAEAAVEEEVEAAEEGGEEAVEAAMENVWKRHYLNGHSYSQVADFCAIVFLCPPGLLYQMR